MDDLIKVYTIKSEDIEIITDKGDYIESDKELHEVEYYYDDSYEKTEIGYIGRDGTELNNEIRKCINK